MLWAQEWPLVAYPMVELEARAGWFRFQNSHIRVTDRQQ